MLIMNKKVLMIAFHFPPDSSIGSQRTFKAAQYLPEMGWDPIILTAKSSAYQSIEKSQQIPDHIQENLYRTIALDVHRHLSFKGKHFEWMTSIDRWTSWIPGAIIKGHKIIKTHKPDVIWSTSPIPSAHYVAGYLSNKFNTPWVADYRDPMSYHHYSVSTLKEKALKYIDKKTIENCNAAVFTTEKARKLYLEKFNHINSDIFYTVENGFDEQNWDNLNDHILSSENPISDDKFSLLYSGVLYPNGRNPEPIFSALSELKKKKVINSENFEFIFQGSGDGKIFHDSITKHGISDIIKFTPPVSYLDSLYYIQQADALVIIQDEVFNFQTPGKLYEYIRTKNPILVVTPVESSTAITAEKYPLSFIASDKIEIQKSLNDIIIGKYKSLINFDIQQFSRRQKTFEMANIFNQLI